MQNKNSVFSFGDFGVSLQNLSVKFYSYNSSALDDAVKKFVSSVKEAGGDVCGPIPMPRKIERLTVTRSPHVDKHSMEHFAKITYTRLVRILNVESSLMEEVSKMEFPAGIGLDVSITNR